jgi:hypothetical protein
VGDLGRRSPPAGQIGETLKGAQATILVKPDGFIVMDVFTPADALEGGSSPSRSAGMSTLTDLPMFFGLVAV